MFWIALKSVLNAFRRRPSLGVPEALTIRCITDLWFYGTSKARTVTLFLGVFNMKAKVQKKIYVKNLLWRAFLI